jgi:Kinesin motor domain
MLLCVTVTGRNRHTSAVSRAKLSLIDLAGSERVGKTDASGERLKEAQVMFQAATALIYMCNYYDRIYVYIYRACSHCTLQTYIIHNIGLKKHS